MMGPPNANARKLKKLAFKIIKTYLVYRLHRFRSGNWGLGV
jgi:hypothetical protein